VHTPYHYVEEPRHARLFASPLLEPLSQTTWVAVPLTWLPVAAFLWHWYAASPAASLAGAATILATGLLLWSLVEYSLHRFVFHIDDALPESGLALTGHFLLHGVHHRVPMDRYRLAIPLPLLGWDVWHALFGSGLIG